MLSRLHRYLSTALLFVVFIVAQFSAGDTGARSTRISQLKATEAEVHAAVLFNFTKFVVWPEKVFTNRKSPFIIAVLGENAFPDSLREMESRTVHGRPVMTRHFPTPADLAECHVLYCNLTDMSQVEEAVDKVQGLPILTVGAHKDFAKRHGIIEFSSVNSRLAVTINLPRARSVGLEIGSDLLEIATLTGQTDKDHGEEK